MTPSLLGEYDKPSLSAWPSPMVPLGQTVTLQCHFRSPRKRFKLFKTDGTSLTELHGNHFNTFTLGPVTREHAGSYTCSNSPGLSLGFPDTVTPCRLWSQVGGVQPSPAQDSCLCRQSHPRSKFLTWSKIYSGFPARNESGKRTHCESLNSGC